MTTENLLLCGSRRRLARYSRNPYDSAANQRGADERGDGSAKVPRLLNVGSLNAKKGMLATAVVANNHAAATATLGVTLR